MKSWIIGFSQFQIKEELKQYLNKYSPDNIKHVNILNYELTDVVNFYKQINTNKLCIVENIDLFPVHFQYKIKQLTDCYSIDTVITSIYRDTPAIIKPIQYKFTKIVLNVENNIDIYGKKYNKYIASRIQTRLNLYTRTNTNITNDKICDLLCILNDDTLYEVINCILNKNYVEIYKSIRNIYSHYGLSYIDIIESLIIFIQHLNTVNENIRYTLIHCLINSIKNNYTHDNHIEILKLAISLQKCSSPSASP